jgi:hemoglobin
MKPPHHLLLSLLFAGIVGACAHPPAAGTDTLYRRLGGEAGIAAIVKDLVAEATTDPRTRRSFDGIRIKHLNHSITMFVCVVAGGQCEYEGEDMKKTHADARVTEAEFDALVAMLRTALDRHVGTREKNELLQRLAPMKRDIVFGD